MVRQVVWYLIVDEGLGENRSHLHLSSSNHRCCRLCFLDSCHVGRLRCGNILCVIDVGVGNLTCLKVIVDRSNLCVLPHLSVLEGCQEGFLGCGHLGGVSDVGIWDLLCLQLLETSELNSVECVNEELCRGLEN